MHYLGNIFVFFVKRIALKFNEGKYFTFTCIEILIIYVLKECKINYKLSFFFRLGFLAVDLDWS